MRQHLDTYKLLQAIQPALTPADCVSLVVPSMLGWAIELTVPRHKTCWWRQQQLPDLLLISWFLVEINRDGRLQLAVPNTHRDWFMKRYGREMRGLFELEDPGLVDQVRGELELLLNRNISGPPEVSDGSASLC